MNLTGGVDYPYWVQKHSAKHLLLDEGREWLRELRHVFVIRDPRVLLAEAVENGSYAPLESTELPHQLELYRWLIARDIQPTVVCNEALSKWPEELITELCRRLDMPFERSMLRAIEEGREPLPFSVRRALREVPRSALRSCDDMFGELLESALCGPEPAFPEQQAASSKHQSASS